MDEEKDWMTTTQPGEPMENESAAANEGGTAVAPSAPPPGLAEAYEKVLAENKDLYDRLLRKQAELENFRKRTQKEKEDLRLHAAEDLVRSLLPTLDGFERALQRRDQSVPPAYYQGLELIYHELREVLGRAGLAPSRPPANCLTPTCIRRLKP